MIPSGSSGARLVCLVALIALSLGALIVCDANGFLLDRSPGARLRRDASSAEESSSSSSTTSSSSSEESSTDATTSADSTTKRPGGGTDRRIIIVKGALGNILNPKNRAAIAKAVVNGAHDASSTAAPSTGAPASTTAKSKAATSSTASPSGDSSADSKKTVVATTVEKSDGGKGKKVTTTKVSKDSAKPEKPVIVESVTEETNAKGQPSKVTVNKMKISPTTTTKKPAATAKAAKTNSFVESSVASGDGKAAAEAKENGVSDSTYKSLCDALPEPIKAFCLLIPSVVARNIDHEMTANGKEHSEITHVAKTEEKLAATNKTTTASPSSTTKPAPAATTAKPTEATDASTTKACTTTAKPIATSTATPT